MVAGESFLKIVDYPFAYSVVAITGAIFGFSISANKIFLLGIAGALGTFLSIVDPLGWVVRKRLKNNPPITDKKVNYEETESYFLGRESILRSRAITIEIDKIISTIYFAFTAGIFLIGIVSSPFLADNFIIHNKSNEIICDSNCIKIPTFIGASFVCIVLGIIGQRRWSDLTEKLAIAITHQKAISNEFVTTNSLENMTRSIEQNDWVTAYEWGEKIEKEIQFKIGKKDKISRAIDNVLRPLYNENTIITTKTIEIEKKKQHEFLPTEAWQKISQNLLFSNLDDVPLKRRIHEFYDKIKTYNDGLHVIITKTNDIINANTASSYNKSRARDVQAWFNTSIELKSPNLSMCALFCIHPKDYFPLSANATFSYVRMVHTSSAGDVEYNTTPSEITIFEDLWRNTMVQVNSDNEILQFRELFSNIKSSSSSLEVEYKTAIEQETHF